MKRYVTACAPALSSAALGVADPAVLSAASGLALPVSGSGCGASFAGTFVLQKFVRGVRGVAAVGLLTGTVTNAPGTVATTMTRRATFQVNVGAATYDVLHLDVGPSSLDFLGLQMNLSEIVLDITAQSDARNLLGHLLGAVAGVLDRPGGLARILNDILGVLVV